MRSFAVGLVVAGRDSSFAVTCGRSFRSALAGLCAAGGLGAGAAPIDAPAVAVAVASTPSSTRSSTPVAIEGTWQVAHVAVAHALAAAAHVRSEPDDARLIGGLRSFEADGRIDPSMPGCVRLAWSAAPPIALSALLRRDVVGLPGASSSAPADYGFHVGDPTLQPYVATCVAEPGLATRTTPDAAGWFALLSDGRMLKGQGPGTVLVLDRITPETPMRAAIDCTQAVGDAQKTICSSRRLAGLDLAVAAAYKHALAAAHRHDEAAAAALRESQAQWRADREKCATDVSCLASRMQERVATLTADRPQRPD